MSEQAVKKLFDADKGSGVSDLEVIEMVEECIQFGVRLAEFAIRTTPDTERQYPRMTSAMKGMLTSLRELLVVQGSEVPYPITPSDTPGMN